MWLFLRRRIVRIPVAIYFVMFRATEKFTYFCSKRQDWTWLKGIVFRFRYFLRGVFRCLLLGFGLSLTFQAVQNGHSKLTALPWTFTSDRQRLVTQRVCDIFWSRDQSSKTFYFVNLKWSINKQMCKFFCCSYWMKFFFFGFWLFER